MSWKPEPITLHWPIDLPDGGRLESVTLRLLDVEEHRAAIAEAGSDEDDQFEALLVRSTGLSLDVIEMLKRPDYITLAQRMHEYSTLPSSYFLSLAKVDPTDLPLLVPVKGTGRRVDSVAIAVPPMKTVKIMRKMKTPDERADFITAACTGMDLHEVKRLSVPDWTQLQVHLHDFLNEPAAYFQSATSK